MHSNTGSLLAAWLRGWGARAPARAPPTGGWILDEEERPRARAGGAGQCALAMAIGTPLGFDLSGVLSNR